MKKEIFDENCPLCINAKYGATAFNASPTELDMIEKKHEKHYVYPQLYFISDILKEIK